LCSVFEAAFFEVACFGVPLEVSFEFPLHLPAISVRGLSSCKGFKVLAWHLIGADQLPADADEEEISLWGFKAKQNKPMKKKTPEK